MNNDLLPPNATQLERDLARTTARVSDVDITSISKLWNADTCPPELLPWLAWSEQVTNWTSDWPIAVQRESIKAQRALRKKLGTRQAIVDAVAGYGGATAIKEWFEMSPPGAPHTFDVVITGGDGYVEAGLQEAMINTIDETKPLRSHYTLGVGLTAKASLYISGVCQVVNYKRLGLTG